MIYFDTSYLVKCYVNETGSTAVRELASRNRRIACCEFGRMELAAALHRALREARINRDHLQTIYEQYERDQTDHIWTWLPMSPDLIAAVTSRFKELETTRFLRTGDAIHLACAAEHQMDAVYSNDTHLLEAADAFGLQGRNVIPD